MAAIGEGSALWGVDLGDGRAIIPMPGTRSLQESRAAADRLIAANPGAVPVLLELRRVENGDK